MYLTNERCRSRGIAPQLTCSILAICRRAHSTNKFWCCLMLLKSTEGAICVPHFLSHDAESSTPPATLDVALSKRELFFCGYAEPTLSPASAPAFLSGLKAVTTSPGARQGDTEVEFFHEGAPN